MNKKSCSFYYSKSSCLIFLRREILLAVDGHIVDESSSSNQFASTCNLVAKHVEAMYATIGYIVPEYYKFPGYLSPSLGLKFADVPNGLASFV